MPEFVNVNIIEDDSVSKKIQKTAKQLNSKYKAKRNINQKLLRKKPLYQKILTAILSGLCAITVLFSFILCFSNINSRIQRVCPTFIGYANLVVKSGSMEKSGLKIKDNVIIHSVDAHSLHEDDIIAFYVYPDDYNQFDIDSCEKVVTQQNSSIKYTTSAASIIGLQSAEITAAAKSGATLVIHHIRSIFKDQNNTYWFKTYGSSNEYDDAWYISENMIVGALDISNFAKTVSGFISFVSSKTGVIVLLIPFIWLMFLIVIEYLKNLQVLKLVYDCVEEKRKITDPICVANHVGYSMDNKNKYKILAQASPENYNQYISLLWRKGEMPENVRKFYLRKKILLEYNRKMLLLNRECEAMFKENKKEKDIVNYYIKTKEALQNEQRQLRRQLIAKKNS